MFEKSSKRRRTNPPTTQSKLYHFFSKPVVEPRKVSSVSTKSTDDKTLKKSRWLLDSEKEKPGTEYQLDNTFNSAIDSKQETFSGRIKAGNTSLSLGNLEVSGKSGNTQTFSNSFSFQSLSDFHSKNPKSSIPAIEKIESLPEKNTPAEGKCDTSPTSNSHTLEELNTCDVRSLQYSAVLNLHTSRTKLHPTLNISPGESLGLLEMDTADVCTLPSSIIIGQVTSKPKDNDSTVMTESDQAKSLMQTEKCPSHVVQQSQEPSYMDRVWAMFESDSEDESGNAKDKLPSKESFNRPKAENSTARNLDSSAVPCSISENALIQTEEMNTSDMLTVPYSPIVGKQGYDESSKTINDGRGCLLGNYSQTIDSQSEVGFCSDEDSLTLQEFDGMKAPDSIFHSIIR